MEDNSEHVEASPFSKEQLEVLQKLFNQNLSQQTVPLPETSLIAQKGNVPAAFLVNKSPSARGL